MENELYILHKIEETTRQERNQLEQEMENELNILRKIEELIRQNQDQLLMEIVPADCKCQGKTKKVFRCPGAFEISVLLSTLVRLRDK